MTFLPSFILNICRRLQKASAWVDEKFFPVPVTAEERNKRFQKDIEDAAGHISIQIDKCASLKQCDEFYDIIADYMISWGNTAQVRCWRDSLMLKLHNKQQEIIDRL